MDKDCNRAEPENQTVGVFNRGPKYLDIDRKIGEIKSSLEFLENEVESKKRYLKELEKVRKSVTPADEARIKALAEVGLL